MPKHKYSQPQLIDNHQARGGETYFPVRAPDVAAWIDQHIDRIEAEKKVLSSKQMELLKLRKKAQGHTYTPYPESAPDKNPVIVTLIIPPECQRMGMEAIMQCTD